jgi:acylphosphatase
MGQSPTMQKILNSGLNGKVINFADGRVEVRLEGEKERLIEFYEDLKKENTPELVGGKTDFYDLDLEFNARHFEALPRQIAMELKDVLKMITLICIIR